MRLPRLVILATAGVITVAAGACGADDNPPQASAPSAVTSTPPISPSPSATTRPPTTRPATPGGPATTSTGSPAARSDLSQLKAIGIDIDKAVLIDVADDGVDRFLQVGKNRVVDFTGTGRTDSTMMSLKPAAVKVRNRVVIKPPFWNEDLGAGSCVADTTGAALQLETCRDGKASQTWQVVPAGDSGQFELRGAYGILHVENGKLTTADRGRTGLQTLDFAD